MKEYYFEIYSQGRDLRGLEIKEELRSLGFKNIENVFTSRVCLLNGDLRDKEEEVVMRIAEELLRDPVSEVFSLKGRTEKGKEISVYFKPGVLDLESKRVLEALEIMGIEGIESVQTVRKYIIDADISEDDCRFLAKKLLYNKVIEKARINVG